jgi:diguanylate cyclase (GGDEF)-like protein
MDVTAGPGVRPVTRFPSLQSATTLAQACNWLVDQLYVGGALPSIYLLVDGRLRCQAARGYFQVVDGFTPGTGVIGHVVADGRTRIIHDVTVMPEFIAAIPGLVAEACAPVLVHGDVVGAVNLECTTALPEHSEERLVAAATELGTCIERLGGMPPVPLAQRLARIAVGIGAMTKQASIMQRGVAGAIEISAMSSGALSRISAYGQWSVEYVEGPLGACLQQWTHEELGVMAGWGGPGTSSHFPGGAAVPPEYEFLRRSGVQAIAVQPLFHSNQLIGLLTTADTRPVQHDPTVGAAIELLAAQVTASLLMADALVELSERAAQDPLTHLRNAGSFAEDMATGQDSRSACLLIDVDHFKEVNDTYGHLVGDQLLCDLAEQLRGRLRDHDVLYRIGGDEFAAILPDTNADDAARIAQRLIHAARRMDTSVSIGMAMLDEGGSESARLRADVALYEAKARGRDRVEICRRSASPGTAAD